MDHQQTPAQLYFTKRTLPKLAKLLAKAHKNLINQAPASFSRLTHQQQALKDVTEHHTMVACLAVATLLLTYKRNGIAPDLQALLQAIGKDALLAVAELERQ